MIGTLFPRPISATTIAPDIKLTDTETLDALQSLPEDILSSYYSSTPIIEDDGLVIDCPAMPEDLGILTFPTCDPSSTVRSIVEFHNEIYAAGNFKTAGGKIVNGIAKWTGSTWTPLSTGVDGIILCMAVLNGKLYVGGGFDHAGGIAAQNIACWDGSTWSALGTGINGNVWTLTRINNDLYAGGIYTTAGGVSTKNIAKWNGTAWSALGTGVNSSVFSSTSIGTDLYIGGQFSQAGGLSANGIAKWDGSSWSALSAVFQVYALTNDGSNIYSGDASGNIYQWSGTTKTSIGDMNGPVYNLSFVGSSLYAGGRFSSSSTSTQLFNVARKSGSSWVGLQFGTNGTVYSLYNSNNTVYVGGSFSQANTLNTNNIATWNNGWSKLSCDDTPDTGILENVTSIIKKENDIFVGESFINVNNKYVNYVARWDGSSWHGLSFGLNAPVNCMAVLGNDLYVGGGFTAVNSTANTSLSYVAKWTGSSWVGLGSGVSSIVKDMKVINGDIYVGGQFSQAGGQPAKGIAKWNGSVWSAVGDGVSYKVNSIAYYNGIIYVGGIFTTAGGTNAKNVAQWNGSTWSNMNIGIASEVYTLEIFEGELYAGGNFTSAGSSSAKRIAKWNGMDWEPLGTGADNIVITLSNYNSELWAGGLFTEINGSPVSYLAKWNNTTWTSTGYDPDGYVYSLLPTTEGLYIGGLFNQINACASSGIVLIKNTATPSCSDGIKNGTEIYVDCGGTCAPCTNCSHTSVSITDNPMADQLYIRASNTIMSSGRVADNRSAIFQAQNGIELQPFFEVNTMGQLEIKIANCAAN